MVTSESHFWKEQRMIAYIWWYCGQKRCRRRLMWEDRPTTYQFTALSRPWWSTFLIAIESVARLAVVHEGSALALSKIRRTTPWPQPQNTTPRGPLQCGVHITALPHPVYLSLFGPQNFWNWQYFFRCWQWQDQYKNKRDWGSGCTLYRIPSPMGRTKRRVRFVALITVDQCGLRWPVRWCSSKHFRLQRTAAGEVCTVWSTTHRRSVRDMLRYRRLSLSAQIVALQGAESCVVCTSPAAVSRGLVGCFTLQSSTTHCFVYYVAA